MSVIDEEALLQRLKRKKNRLQRLLTVFQACFGNQLEQISQAVAQNDAPALALSAHTYKGTVSSFEAPTATALALELETRGRDQRLEGSQAIVEQLRIESVRLEERLVSLLTAADWAE